MLSLAWLLVAASAFHTPPRIPQRKLFSSLPGDDPAALVEEARRLRDEAAAAELELSAGASEAVPEPPPSAPLVSCSEGVARRELIPFDAMTRSFHVSVALAQTAETNEATGADVVRRTPAEFFPWFRPVEDSPAHWRREQWSIMFQKRLELPLGIVLEEGDDGRVVVVELAPDGNGARAGVREGDLLRACSAVRTVLINEPGAGFLNTAFPEASKQPKRRVVLAPCDKQPFDDVMDAVLSNREAPELPAVLLFERYIDERERRGEVPSG